LFAALSILSNYYLPLSGALCVKGVSVFRIQNFYIAGFAITSAIMNMFLEQESVGIKVFCIILLLGNFIFAFLFHHFKSKNYASPRKNKAEE
jgi:hypothetical protein